MKKRALLVCSLAISAMVSAQSQSYTELTGGKPVKLQDVVDEYMRGRTTIPGEGDEKTRNGKTKREGLDYHFSRWHWYWEAHTDENGYLVSPEKTYDELQKMRSKKAMLKTTAAVMADWKFQGPTSSFSGYSGIGRINNVAFHPTNTNTFWVCTAGGGLWKTTNNGVSWVTLTDTLPVLGTSDLAVNPINPNTMYLCTGDRDASDSYSIGVLKSMDGGLSWSKTGLNWTTIQGRLTNAIVMNRLDTNSLTLATSEGIYKSYNGGVSWSQRIGGNFKQVLYHPTDTNVLYATTYGTGQANMYRSANGGTTWTQIGTLSGKRRITLAVTPANIAIVKAIAANANGGLEGIYNSTDTGKTFTKIYGPSGCNGDLISGSNAATPTSCGNQGWYDLSIAVSPTNPNLVIVGGVNSHISNNGGSSWVRVTQWWGQNAGVATVHADKHWHAFHPTLTNRLFECNDGGIYYTDNLSSASIWNDVSNGLGITQFYRNAVAGNAPYVLAGSQDNGTKGLQGGVWDDVNGGDGMDCQIDYVDQNTYYTATQYGNIDRSSFTWGDDQISNNIPGQPTGAWITPYIISPHNHDHLIAGYRHIYFSADAGDSWMSIAGVPLDGSKNLERIAMTPASDSTIYAVTEGTTSSKTDIYYTHNFIPGGTATFSVMQPPYNGNISDIKVDPRDRNHFWVTFSGYNGARVAEYNAGVWALANTGLPNVPVHCFEIDSSTNIMYVGTDVGVFYQDTITKQWEPFNINLPSIEVADLGINYTDKEVWAATYGRGLWKSIKQEYLPTTDTTDTSDTTGNVALIPLKQKDITIAPNPSNGNFKVSTTTTLLLNKDAEVLVFDNMGRIVWKGRTSFNGIGYMNLNMETLPKGLYILELKADNKYVSRQQIVIQ